METQEYLTQEKYNELKAELDQLVHVKRKEIAEHLEYAKSLGDLSENAEYHEARDDQANIEDRIAKIESILKSAIIMTSSHDTNSVNIGSVVVVQKEGGDEKTYTLVGSEESDMAAGKMSVKSPLGRALIGKKKKDAFTIQTPSGAINYRVIDIK
ncbi:MAG TPA: transcription elongation factor GreA [Candidatus Nanoarchaeia archaeon]|nr:transcription elongation factor GreA [Candidatus Nanoarchaeia archaeon]